MERKMTNETKILDKGFVKLIDHMGSDDAIVQSARVSYGSGTKTKLEDSKLINYLLTHDHMTPFEMTVFKFHVKLPIFVARQWMRHRVGSFNEVSARYSLMTDDYYLPGLSRIKGQSKTNKQCSGDELIILDQIIARNIIESISEDSYQEYEQLLDLGVARELARMVLPVNYYTEFYWKVDLRNLLSFIKLRSDSHAQWEIQQYSNAMFEMIKPIVPASCESFINNK